MSGLHVNSLRKHEILRKEQLIAALFVSGKSCKGEYLKLFYQKTVSDVKSRSPAVQVLFAVSKKKRASCRVAKQTETIDARGIS